VAAWLLPPWPLAFLGAALRAPGARVLYHIKDWLLKGCGKGQMPVKPGVTRLGECLCNKTVD
jgi:hypothetical protein